MAKIDFTGVTSPGDSVAKGLGIAKGIQGIKQSKAAEERAAQGFELNKAAAVQKLETDIALEQTRQKKIRINDHEGLFDIAMEAGDKEEADFQKQQISKEFGRVINVDNATMHKMVIDSRKAKKDGDTERVKAIEQYMLKKSTTVEEEARRLNIQSEVESLSEERKLSEDLTRSEAAFEQKKTQAVSRQVDITKALRAVEGVTEAEAQIGGMAGANQIPANIAGQLIAAEGGTVRGGFKGTGEFEGQQVSLVFGEDNLPRNDEEGNLIQIAEQPTAASARDRDTTITVSKDLLDRPVFTMTRKVRNKDGNIIGFEILPQLTEEGEAVEELTIDQIDTTENFSFEEYKAKVDPDTLASSKAQDIADTYLELVRLGAMKRNVKGAPGEGEAAEGKVVQPEGANETVGEILDKPEIKGLLEKATDRRKHPLKAIKEFFK